MLVEAFLNYLEYEKRYSKHTILAYQKDIAAFTSFCLQEFQIEDIIEVSYSQIRKWIVFLVTEKKLSNRTVNRKITSLKSFYKFLVKIEEINNNPLQGHKALKIQKKMQIPFNKEEVNTVLNTFTAIEETFENLRDKLIIEILYTTGVRRAELIAIKEGDIDLHKQTIKIFGKRKKERYVVLLNIVSETLVKYLKLKKELGYTLEELFVTSKGNKLYETFVYRVINLYFSRVSLKVKKSPHMLRHTFATHLLNNGATLYMVKELLGHSSLAATQIYTHSSLDKIKQVFNKTHPRELE